MSATDVKTRAKPKPRYRGFYYLPVGRFAIVSGRGRDSELSAGDLIVSVDGDRAGDVYQALQNLTLPVTIEVVKVWGKSPRLCRITLSSVDMEEGVTPVHPSVANLWAIEGLGKLAVNALAFSSPDTNESLRQNLLRQRRILANHLREAIVANHALRAEMRASQMRSGEVVQEMMAEISGHRTDMLIKNMEIKKITAERDALELERNQLKARLVESKATNRRRVTHIKLGNELFRNRTKEHV